MLGLFLLTLSSWVDDVVLLIVDLALFLSVVVESIDCPEDCDSAGVFLAGMLLLGDMGGRRGLCRLDDDIRDEVDGDGGGCFVTVCGAPSSSSRKEIVLGGDDLLSPSKLVLSFCVI